MTVSLTPVLQVKEAYPLLNELRDRDLYIYMTFTAGWVLSIR